MTRRALDQEKALRPYVSADWVLSKSSWNGNCCARMQGADAIDSERGAGWRENADCCYQKTAQGR